jgi:hypothetical protein
VSSTPIQVARALPPGDPAFMAALKNAHFELSTDDERRVVTLVRSEEQFHSIREMVAVLDEIFQAVSGIDGKEYGLLIDNRRGPTRYDPAFQEAFRSFRIRLDGRFVRVGIVLASESGIQQLADAGPSPNVRAYMNMDSALRWAAEGREE